MVTPLVSIIIPCWNAEAYVGDAIESALDQTYPNVEVIVIDDGSTDRSLQVIKSLRKRIRYETGLNRGACAARNKGLALSSGDFVQFLDADDRLFPEKLARQLPLAVENPTSIVYCDRWETAEDAEPIRYGASSNDSDPLILVLRHPGLQTSAPLYRREWLSEVGGFRAGLSAAQEFDLNLRLAAALSSRGISFVHLPQALYELRRRENSISSNAARTFEATLTFLPEFFEHLLQNGELTDLRRAAGAECVGAMGRYCLRNGSVEAGNALLQLAEWLDKEAVDTGVYSWRSRTIKDLLGAAATEKLRRLYWRATGAL